MTVYTRSTLGYRWNREGVRDAFSGADETSEDVDFLVAETMRRWDSAMRARGWDIGWVPATGELHHPVGLNVESDELDEIREQIMTAIWDEWCDGVLVDEQGIQ